MIFPFFNIATIEKKVGFVSNLDSEKSMLKGLSSSFKKKKCYLTSDGKMMVE